MTALLQYAFIRYSCWRRASWYNNNVVVWSHCYFTSFFHRDQLRDGQYPDDDMYVFSSIVLPVS